MKHTRWHTDADSMVIVTIGLWTNSTALTIAILAVLAALQ